MRQYNIIFLGSAGVGKSSLIDQFIQGIFVNKYDPTIEDSYRKWIEVDGHQYMLDITDSAGTDQFSAMRDVYMKNGDGFVLVYSITSKSSFEATKKLRQDIVHQKNDYKVPIVLVGNKCDLGDERVVNKEQGAQLAWNFNDCQFFETSAKAKINVNEIFVDIVKQINKTRPQIKQASSRKKCCIIL